MGALFEVSRGGQRPSAPQQHQLLWSSATGWCRPYRYSIFQPVVHSDSAGTWVFVTPLLMSVCFSYRPQQRQCMTSYLQLHPWTASPSQKAGPPPAGPAELLSPQTSEKVWQRPTTPSERCVLKVAFSKFIMEPSTAHAIILPLSHSWSSRTVNFM